VLEILTVGLPFCAFKLLTGLVAYPSPVAYPLLILGAIDAVLNVVNLFVKVPTCFTDLVLRRHELALALDVFISFALVAIVIGFSLLPRLPAWALPIWSAAVILNVLGAGVGRLLAATRTSAS
jgi:hypothetical protein